MKIKIKTRFKELIPALLPEERSLLEQQIIADGCRDPLVVWPIRKGNEKCSECKGKPDLSGTIEEKINYQLRKLGHTNVGIAQIRKQNGKIIWVDVETSHNDEHLSGDQSGFYCLDCGSPDYDSDIEYILVDGHNRYDICTKNKIEFKTECINFADETEAEDWIDANQLGRRNLTPDQASIARGRRYNRTKKAQGGTGANQHEQSSQIGNSAKTCEKLAEFYGVSKNTIIRDGKRAEALEKLAEVAPDEAKAVRDGLKRFNQVQRERKKVELQSVAKLPDAKFRIVYADPPWSYNDKCDDGSVQSGGCEKHYPSMTIPQLCAMPIDDICERNAVLFLWVTSPLLQESFELIKAWGFSYKSSFVWDKVKHNMGHYNSVRHEFLLVCTRGSCTPDNAKLYDSVQSIERTKHSSKPEEFRAIIDDLYPHGKRIELFARKKIEGWHSYGNQA